MLSPSRRQDLETRLNRLWYAADRRPSAALRIAARGFGALVGVRRWLYRHGVLSVHNPAVPVVVVGNVTVGGSGKTPLVIALCELAREMGHRAGIISRGYGARVGRGPIRISPGDDAARVGDEPVLMARRTGAPVMVGSDRVACARSIESEVDLIISDDGLQHYRLGRQLEIIVVDAQRGIGNGRLIPAGPLREPARRLAEADLVVRNGAPDGMRLKTCSLVNLRDPARTLSPADLEREEVHAVAGIGHPERFFSALSACLDARIVEHRFADHHRYGPEDLADVRSRCVVMTEKDAVKCGALAGEDWWYLPVEAQLPEALEAELRTLFASLMSDTRR